MKFGVITISILLAPWISLSQVPDDNQQDFSEIFEIVLSVQGENVNPEQVYESLLQLSNNPVNINRASKEELSSLLFLSSSQIDSLQSYRSKHNGFVSLEELYYVDGFPAGLAGLLQPFLTVEAPSSKEKPGIRNLLKDGKKSVVTRYSRQAEKPEGYNSSSGKKNIYLGNPDQYMMKFSMTLPENISAGFAFEKDKGEPLVWAPSKNFFGLDHYSGQFSLMNRGILRDFTIGDYKILFGQGLVLGNGFYFGKSAEPIASVRSRTQGIRPYSGSGESGFFRGAASEIRMNRITLTSFLSWKKADARIENESINDEQQSVIRSFSVSGLHRTISEIERRKNSNELSAGYHFGYNNTNQNFTAGSSGIFTKYNRMYLEKPVYYNQFDFYGQEQLTLGVDYNYYHRKFNVFGEAAFSGSNGWGITQGIIGNLSKNIETAVHIRYYSPSFHSFYGNPFRESSTVGNESGIYWGLRILPVKKISLNMYFDVFRFPWLRYNLKSPSAGNELFSKITYNPGGKFEWYAQYLRKTMDAAFPGSGNNIPVIVPGVKQQLLAQFSVKTGTHLQLRTRIQWSNYILSVQKSSGMAAFQDLGWNFKNGSIHGRLLWFRTDDYLNRQYIFEQGVLYDYQVPAYDGNGTRIYLMGNLKAGGIFHFWAAAGRTIYRDKKQVGTGTEMISGNHKTDFTLQCEFKF
jgi:hypothetical protein